MITITIDDKTIETDEGSTVMDAALAAEIYIPHMCHSDGLEPYGACRMCIVKLAGQQGMQTACTLKAANGMVIQNDCEEVNKVRRMICEMIIADHPLTCLSCAANQRCELQRVASWLGITGSRLRRMVRKPIIDESNPFYKRDLSKCILCGLCVRSCNELRSIGAIDIAGRGYESRISAFGDKPIIDSPCVSCGECVDRCPVDALWTKNETTPPDNETRTTCPYCGCGCGLILGTRAGKIVSIRGDKSNPASKGSLCVKGRFGLDFVGSNERLTTPLIRKNGELEKATWDEALALIADKMESIKEKSGPDAIAGLSSAKVTNEENYVFQKFIRAAVGTNNVDHCARLCHASTVAGLAKAFGSGAMTNSTNELENAACVFVTGSNTTEAHPIIGMKLMNAAKNGITKLIVADPRRIDLVDFADLHIRQRSGTDVALFNAMMNVIISENLHDMDFIKTRTEDFDKLELCVKDCTPEWAETITGIPADDIRTAARIYAAAETSSIVYSMGITQHSTGTDNVLALANLAMLTGNVGRLSTGVNPLRGQNNVQGACDLGALPDVYPGYQKVDDPNMLSKFQNAWGVELSDKPGMTVVEIMNAAGAGKIKCLYIMGENPMLSDPNLNHVKEMLEKLHFLVVQDIFLTETAELADVVLPAASFAEKNGTFTSTERRVQRVRAAVPTPGDARQDWKIICDLSELLGYTMNYNDPSEIMDEIASISPIYGGISFERIEKTGLQWPCSDSNHPGTALLHANEFTRGKGKFHATPFIEADELPDNKYPFLLTTGRYLYHFHTRTMTGRSPGLEQLCPPVPVEIHPNDAKREGINDGDKIEISSRRGTIQTTAKVTRRSREGTVFVAFHYKEAPANMLTNDALDPIAKIPEFKVCAVNLKKV